MEEIKDEAFLRNLRAELRADCGSCRGICCCALFFSKDDGFPCDKTAGEPCEHLAPDYRCRIHRELRYRGLHGCSDYDCLGAGQKASLAVSGTENGNRALLYRVFTAIYRLHQILWYLGEAYGLECAGAVRGETAALIGENRHLAALSPDELLRADIGGYKLRADAVLKKAAALASRAAGGGPGAKHSRICIGRDFRGDDLRGGDFSMSLLIAADLRGCRPDGANFLGADLRDADLSDADLSRCVFLTQMQINSAKGSAGTKLPPALSRPPHWNGI